MCYRLQYRYESTSALGIIHANISNLGNIRGHFSNWRLEYDLPGIIPETAARYLTSRGVPLGGGVSPGAQRGLVTSAGNTLIQE